MARGAHCLERRYQDPNSRYCHVSQGQQMCTQCEYKETDQPRQCEMLRLLAGISTNLRSNKQLSYLLRCSGKKREQLANKKKRKMMKGHAFASRRNGEEREKILKFMEKVCHY